MTSLLRRQLEASLELENEGPGVRMYRQTMMRRRPDLSNKSDTDVLEWMQRVETNAAEFHEQFSNHPNAYEQDAEEIVDRAKRLIIAIQDARERAGIDV